VKYQEKQNVRSAKIGSDFQVISVPDPGSNKLFDKVKKFYKK